MPKRTSKSRARDVNQLAHRLVEMPTIDSPIVIEPSPVTESDISRVMAAMGRRGGQIGGKRRLETMTPERRREIAKKAASSRWERTSNKNRKQS
jgi:hypothetical protein